MFKFFDGGTALIGLLAKNDGLKAKLFEKSRNTLKRWLVMAVDDKDLVLGKRRPMASTLAVQAVLAQ